MFIPDHLQGSRTEQETSGSTLGISSKDLADNIDGARFYKTFGEIVQSLRETAQPGDIILTVGAGNVYKIGEQLLEDDYE